MIFTFKQDALGNDAKKFELWIFTQEKCVFQENAYSA